jgi:hypothetical protein
MQNELLQAFRSDQFQSVIQQSVDKAIGQKLENLEKRVDVNSTEIDKLVHRVDLIGQQLRSNNLIFSGISEPDNDKFHLKAKIIEIAAFLKVSIQFHDIVMCYRIPNRKATNSPRLVLVSFLNREARSEIYGSRIKLKGFKGSRIYINEDLCPSASEIYFTARRRVKELSLFSVWTMNGVTHVKQKRDTVPIKILSINDVAVKLTDNMST